MLNKGCKGCGCKCGSRCEKLGRAKGAGTGVVTERLCFRLNKQTRKCNPRQDQQECGRGNEKGRELGLEATEATGNMKPLLLLLLHGTANYVAADQVASGNTEMENKLAPAPLSLRTLPRPSITQQQSS